VCADKLFYGHTFLDAIAQYHKEYDEEKQCFIEHPDHDWSSHSADALRIMAQAVNIPAERDAFQIRTETKWNPFAKGADEAQYEQDGVRDELRHPFLDR
jgi:hypothetical protein